MAFHTKKRIVLDYDTALKYLVKGAMEEMTLLGYDFEKPVVKCNLEGFIISDENNNNSVTFEFEADFSD